VYSAGEGRGCTFYIDLPVLRTQPKQTNVIPSVAVTTTRLFSSSTESIRGRGLGLALGLGFSNPSSSSSSSSPSQPPRRFPFHRSSSSSNPTNTNNNNNSNNIRSAVTSNRNSSNYPSVFSHQSANSTYSSPSVVIPPPLTLATSPRPPSRSQLVQQPQQPLRKKSHGANPQLSQQKQQPPLQRLKRVLIVDDSAMNRKLLKRSLQNIVDSCDEAVHGKDCLEKVKQAMEKDREAMDAAGMINIQQPQPMGYEVIITDYFMPEMNGLEAIGHLRKAEGDFKYGGMIIGLTGNADEATKLAFEEAGANVVLTKPFSTDQLQSILQGKLRTQSLNNLRNLSVVTLYTCVEFFQKQQQQQ